MSNLSNHYITDIGTSFTDLYTCILDYSIISGLTISNKLNQEIKINVRVIDNTNIITSYLVNNSKISSNTSLALCGDLMKIVLKNNDKIDIKSSIINSVDVNMSIIEGT